MTELRIEPERQTSTRAPREATYSAEYVDELRRGSLSTWGRYIRLALELDRARAQAEMAIEWIRNGRTDLALLELQDLISET